MRRILIAAHGFPPTHSAGAERRAERMANWLSANGYEVSVFAVEQLDAPHFRVQATEQNGYTVHRLYYNVKDGDHFHNLYDYPPVGEAFQKLLAEHPFDLVHLVSGYLLGGQVIFGARNAGVPLAITLTEYWFMCNRLNLVQPTGALCSGPDSHEKCMRCLMEDQRRFRLPAQTMPHVMNAFWDVASSFHFGDTVTQAVAQRQHTLRSALEAANLVICPSAYLISKFKDYGFDTQRFTFMRQGLKKPDHAAIQRNQPQSSIRIGYVGQIKYHKGVDLLIDAAISLLSEGYAFSLDLWGSETEDPQYTSMLKQRAAAYPTIRWNGKYIGSKVWDVMASLDALVIPSRWYENSPNAILEAFEMRVPVIGTKLGGMAELIQHRQNGMLFELNDANDLKAQLKALLTDSNLLPTLKQNIPAVKSIDEEMHELTGMYDRLLAAVG